VKIVAIADTHGRHEEVGVPEADILVHAGDVTNAGSLEELVAFNDFLGTLPHPHKIVIAGNHDFCFERERIEAERTLTNATYLHDSDITIDGIRFYGSPWQPEFMNWAFNLPRGEALAQKWKQIPADTDILITHSPPFGLGDLTRRGEQVGCKDLRRRLSEVRPSVHVFGHIHENTGIWTDEDVVAVNASVFGRPNQCVLIDWYNGTPSVRQFALDSE